MTTHHLTLSVAGRVALARDERERRALVRVFVRASKGRFLAFDMVDDHAHAGLVGPRPRLLARDVRRALAAMRPDLVLEAPHLKPVEGRRYLRWLVTYFLNQPLKHGLDVHPALWTGSCFPDLVGARLLPGFSTAPLRAALPRLGVRDLFKDVGLDPVPLQPVDDDALLGAGAARLAELAASVYGVGPGLVGRSGPVVKARTLAAVLGVRLGLSRVQLNPFLNATPQAIGRLASRPVDPKGERALRLRFALEERVRLQALRRPA
jgi:hypothetical protein